MTNQHIEASAHHVADAESRLTEATAAHAVAVAKADEVRNRVKAVHERRAAIRADLAAGRLSEKEAGGLVCIANDDESDLSEILKDAESDVIAAANAASIASNNHGAAINAMAQTATKAEFDALSAHVLKLENALSGAVGELYGLGVCLGMPRALSSVWRPSPVLQRAIALGVPPPRISA